MCIVSTIAKCYSCVQLLVVGKNKYKENGALPTFCFSLRRNLSSVAGKSRDRKGSVTEHAPKRMMNIYVEYSKVFWNKKIVRVSCK